MLSGCAAEQPQAVQETPLQENQQTPEQQTEAPQDASSPSETALQEMPETTMNVSTGANESSSNESLSEQPLPQTSSRCKDTDVTTEHPDGINFDVVGNVTINGKPLERGTDYCANLVTISEWYCMGDIPRVKTTKCPGECQKGVCV